MDEVGEQIKILRVEKPCGLYRTHIIVTTMRYGRWEGLEKWFGWGDKKCTQNFHRQIS